MDHISTPAKDPRDAYFEQINHTLLTEEQEHALAARIAAGDTAARTELACANLRLVVGIARHSARTALPYFDRVQEGNIGMFRATEDFDPVTYKTRFATYAGRCIQTQIDRAANEAGIIYVPREAIDDLFIWKAKYEELAKVNGVEPSPQEVARALGYAEAHIPNAIDRIWDARHARRSKSTDAPIRGGKREDPFGQFLASSSKQPLEILIEREEQTRIQRETERIRRAIACSVDPLQARVLMRRLFYFENDEETQPDLAQIARELSITREMARKYELRGMERLEEALRHQELPGSACVDRLWREEADAMSRENGTMPFAHEVAGRFGIAHFASSLPEDGVRSAIKNGGPHPYEYLQPEQFDHLLHRIRTSLEQIPSPVREITEQLYFPNPLHHELSHHTAVSEQFSIQKNVITQHLKTAVQSIRSAITLAG